MSTIRRETAGETTSVAAGALERGAGALRALQSPSGYWWGELESNAAITAEHVFLTSILGTATRRELDGLAAELLATQRGDGTWTIWFGGPPDLSVTVEAYYALRLAGIPADAPPMLRARDAVRDMGGVNRARFFTRLWLAVLGRYPWDRLPALQPELIFLPPRAPLSPYRFASWARGTFVALMAVMSLRPRYLQPLGIDELFLEPPGTNAPVHVRAPGRWSPWLARCERVGRAYGRHPLPGPRRRAYARIARWLCERQEADGSWGGIQPPWVYSLIALHALGFPLDHPVMARGLRGFDERFRIEDGERIRIQSCLSPIWDTALATIALEDAGDDPGGAAVRGAVDWLVDKEVRRYGDWHVLPRRGRPGGWSFEFSNQWYPDTDDTAEVLIALSKARPRARPPRGPARRRVAAGDGVHRRGLGVLRRRQRHAHHASAAHVRLRRGARPADRGRDRPRGRGAGHLRTAEHASGGAPGRRVPAQAPVGGRLLVGPLGGQPHLRDGRGRPGPGQGRGPHRRPGDPARGRLARATAEHRRRLGRERGKLPRPGLDRPWRVHALADRLGAASRSSPPIATTLRSTGASGTWPTPRRRTEPGTSRGTRAQDSHRTS